MDGRMLIYNDLILTCLNEFKTLCKCLENDNFERRELSYDGRCHITHLNMPLELQEFEVPRISRQSPHECDQIFGPAQQSPVVPLRYYSFLSGTEPTPGP
jgi:hypothetical protein